jgi:hypothetical protein
MMPRLAQGPVHNAAIEIGRGDGAIERTAQVMRELITAGSAHPLVRDHAERAVVGVRPGQRLEEIRRVRDYLAARVEYRRDPVSAEWIQTPWRILGQIDQGRRPQLDCDDLTVVSLAMLGAVGYDGIVKVVSTRPDGAFNHVYGLVELDDDVVVPLDLTRAWAPRGAPWPDETRSIELPVAA